MPHSPRRRYNKPLTMVALAILLATLATAIVPSASLEINVDALEHVIINNENSPVLTDRPTSYSKIEAKFETLIYKYVKNSFKVTMVSQDRRAGNDFLGNMIDPVIYTIESDYYQYNINDKTLIAENFPLDYGPMKRTDRETGLYYSPWIIEVEAKFEHFLNRLLGYKTIRKSTLFIQVYNLCPTCKNVGLTCREIENCEGEKFKCMKCNDSRLTDGYYVKRVTEEKEWLPDGVRFKLVDVYEAWKCGLNSESPEGIMSEAQAAGWKQGYDPTIFLQEFCSGTGSVNMQLKLAYLDKDDNGTYEFKQPKPTLAVLTSFGANGDSCLDEDDECRSSQ